MKVDLLPKTKSGKWSLVLIVAMPVLFFVGMSFTNSLYGSTPAGRTILEDIVKRPALALTMVSGMLTGILAFITGLLAITRQKERSVLVFVSTFIGMVFVLFLAGELLFPH